MRTLARVHARPHTRSCIMHVCCRLDIGDFAQTWRAGQLAAAAMATRGQMESGRQSQSIDRTQPRDQWLTRAQLFTAVGSVDRGNGKWTRQSHREEWTARGGVGSLWTHGGEGGSSSHPTSRTTHGRDDGMDATGWRGFLMDAWRGRGFLIPPHITHRTWEGRRNGRHRGKRVPYGRMEGKGVPHPTPHHAPHMGGTTEWTPQGEEGSLWTHGGEGGSSSHPISRTAHGRDDRMDATGGRGFLMDAWKGRGFLIPPHITHRTWEGRRNGRPGGKGVLYPTPRGRDNEMDGPGGRGFLMETWRGRRFLIPPHIAQHTWEGRRNGRPGGKGVPHPTPHHAPHTTRVPAALWGRGRGNARQWQPIDEDKVDSQTRGKWSHCNKENPMTILLSARLQHTRRLQRTENSINRYNISALDSTRNKTEIRY